MRLQRFLGKEEDYESPSINLSEITQNNIMCNFRYMFIKWQTECNDPEK